MGFNATDVKKNKGETDRVSVNNNDKTLAPDPQPIFNLSRKSGVFQ